MSAAAPAFDLQSHSVHSDGALTPADVVAAAAAAGIELLALTDHDTAAGVGEARRAALAAGIDLVTGTEISAIFEQRQDLHILGYRIDPGHPELVGALQRSRADRERRAERMAARLRELGFSLHETGLARRAAQGKAIGRPHLAQAVVCHPGNHERLVAEDLLEPTQFLVAYLTEGRPGYTPREAPTVAQAIELIHRAGGLAVWAHPFWDVAADTAVLDAIERFQGAGLDGVEAFYVTHTEDQTRLLVAHCERAGLLTTGSSDFHGPEHAVFSRFRAFSTYGLTPSLGPLTE